LAQAILAQAALLEGSPLPAMSALQVVVSCLLPVFLDASTASGSADAAVESHSCVGHPQSASELLTQLTPLSSYDPVSRPNITGPATPVQVQVALTSITSVDDKQFSFGVSGYLRTMWVDPRLAYSSRAQGGCFNQFNVPASDWSRVWQPDLYFDNSLSQSWGSSSLQVLPTGAIVKSQRFDHKFECNDMFLGRMPFDRQRCKIVIGSFSESANDVYVTPYQGTNGVVRPECYTGTVDWSIDSLGSVLDTSQRGTESNMQPWTMVHLEFVFKRLHMYYMRGYVLVAALFTLASWSGFFISPRVAPARVAIGVIPLLTMITLSNGIYAKLPTIPYTTWLNGYIFICLFFCTLTVFEFGLVSYCLYAEDRNLQRLEVLKSLSFLKKINTADAAARAFKRMCNTSSSNFAAKASSIMIPTSASRSNSTQVVPLEPPLEPKLSTVNGTESGETSDGLLADMSELQESMIQSAFCLFRWDESESISLREARRGMRNFGQFWTMGQVQDMFIKLKIDEGSHMQKKDFVNFLRNYDTVVPPQVFAKSFLDMPWSHQVDYTMRILYIVSFFLVSMIWLCLISWYDDSVSLQGRCNA